MSKIEMFRNEFAFLSNFYPVKFEIDGKEYASAEHAYQSFKGSTEEEQETIRKSPTAAIAKKRGSTTKLCEGFQEIKLNVMEKVLRAKFSVSDMKEALLATGDCELVEGNYWGDYFWGFCLKKNVGENHLGRILMKIREDLKVENK